MVKTKKGSRVGKFYKNNKFWIWLSLGLILAIGITVLILYLSGIIGGSSSNGGGGFKPNPKPFPNKMISGSWVNASSVPWNNVIEQDLLMLASYTPNPWSTLYPCTIGFSIAKENYPNIKKLVDQGHQKAKQVLISVGGSSFGLPEWNSMLYKYVQNLPKQECECPDGSYWYSCTDTSSPCPGGVFPIKKSDGSDCCSDKNNPHKCCCGYGHHIVDGKCVPSTKPDPNHCSPGGVIPGKESSLAQCLKDAGSDTTKALKCIQDNTDPVLAYADLLMETGADGIDLDYETPDPAGNLSVALVEFCKDLKTEMRRRGKTIYISITILSGNSYGAQYKGIYDSIKTSTSPFDYAIPMLYNGGQYPYDTNKDSVSQNHWNGLLNYWRKNFMNKNSNTKLIAAFIEYSGGKVAFTCNDLQHFIENYITNPLNDGGVNVEGCVYFYYSTDYDIGLLNQNLKKTNQCFNEGKCNISC